MLSLLRVYGGDRQRSGHLVERNGLRAAKSRPSRRGRFSRLLRLESLEDRALLSVTILEETFQTVGFTFSGPYQGTGTYTVDGELYVVPSSGTVSGGGSITYSDALNGEGEITIDVPEFRSFSGSFTDVNGTVSASIVLNVSGTWDASTQGGFTYSGSGSGTVSVYNWLTGEYMPVYVTGTSNGSVTCDEPDLSVTAASWTTGGGIQFGYENSGGPIANSDRSTAVSNVTLYWASGTTADTILSSASSESAPIYWNQATGTAELPAADLTSPPAEAAYLLAIADYDGTVAESNEDNNILAFAVVPTTTIVTSDHPDGSVYGEAVTFAAVVSANVGTDIPTGSVQFVIDGAAFGSAAALVNGTASIVVDSLGAGTHSIDAVYASEDLDRFLNSQTAAPLAADVSKADAIAAISSLIPDVSVYGQPLTFTVMVSAVTPSTAIPTGTVLFKDGARALGLVALENGVAEFTTSSVLLSRGSHMISAVYPGNDNWNAAATAPLSQTVQTAALEPDPLDPTKYTLAVGGTASNDVMYVSYSSSTSQVLILVSGGMSYRANHDVANLAHIALYGAAGKDQMRVNASVPVPVLLFGGDGNDSLWAGSAGSVLVGGKGNDSLQGGSGRDVLIGGPGSDSLNGQGDQDILIGGTTDHDNDLAALELVMAEWKRIDATFTQRHKHLLGPDQGGLPGGLNGTVYLDPATVHDDAAVDYLLGGAGTDWYFATSGTIRDLMAARTLGEIVTSYS